jgi:hypothetical protein
MSATLKVYPNKFNMEFFEENVIKSGVTFTDYLEKNVSAYSAEYNYLLSLQINNQLIEESEWPTLQISDGDVLDVFVEAKDPITIAYAVIAVIAVGAAIYAMNQIPDNYNQTSASDGSTIYKVNAQGNQPKLMGVIPELAGRHKVFPDLLNQPRYEYIDNEQWLYLMVAVSVGSVEILDGEILIGDTPLNRYYGDYELTKFEPGEDVSAHGAHRNIYTSAEVSGFELEGAVSSGTTNSNIEWTFKNKTLTYYRIVENSNDFDDDEEYREKRRFPYDVADIISIDSVGTPNDGYFKVVSITGYPALLEKVDIDGNVDTTWTGFTEQTFVRATIELQGSTNSYSGPFFACPTKEKTDKLFLDFNLPQGLGKLDDDGEFSERTVYIQIQYRDENVFEWESITHVFRNSTNDQLAETLEIDLGSKIRPEVRVKRTTSDSDDTSIYDLVQWIGLKSELETVTSYPDVSTIALKIKGSNNLSSQAENKFNVVATRKLPIYDSELQEWSTPQVTQDIIPFFTHVIKDVGHTDEQLDLDELARLHTLWSVRSDHFNGVFDSGSTLFEVLKRVLAVGYAVPTLDYGKIIPVRDEPREVFEHMYQPQNMVKGGLTHNITLIDDDEPDGVEIEYFSSTTWKSETIMCLLSGDEGINPEKIRAYGVTDETKAWRFGMYKRRLRRYRHTQYSFKTEMDALNSSYLSYAALADDLPGYSQTGFVDQVNEQLLQLDQELEWADGTHIISIRKPDGKLSGPHTATRVSDDNIVMIDAALDFKPIFNGSTERPMFMFGTLDRWSYHALITDIKPNGTEEVSVTAVNYDERVYADYDNSPD